jgi:hypothetical protein
MAILAILTVGFPYCVFKVLTGLRIMEWFPAWRAAGLALMVLGVVDFFINLANFAGFALRGRRVTDACAFAILARRFGGASRPAWTLWDLGNSLDVLLAMTIVAVMIGTNAFSKFPPVQLAVWNVSVILSVMGAGVMRFGASLRRVSEGPGAERRST